MYKKLGQIWRIYEKQLGFGHIVHWNRSKWYGPKIRDSSLLCVRVFLWIYANAMKIVHNSSCSKKKYLTFKAQFIVFVVSMKYDFYKIVVFKTCWFEKRLSFAPTDVRQNKNQTPPSENFLKSFETRLNHSDAISRFYFNSERSGVAFTNNLSIKLLIFN